jgi:hypothetical protein
MTKHLLMDELRELEGSKGGRSGFGGSTRKNKKDSKEKELDDLTMNLGKARGVKFIE